MKNIAFFFLPILLLALSGCKSAPPIKAADLREGQWRGKALIKDLDEKKSYIVILNVNAQRDHRVRMDVLSTLGTGVASIVATDADVRYVLIPEKKFFIGQPSADVMKPILMIPFDPRWLHNILFEQPFVEKSWTCIQDKQGLLEACEDSVTGLKVSWKNRSGDKKTVMLEHPRASVQININAFKPKVEDRKSLFSLDAPSGYRRYRVR